MYVIMIYKNVCLNKTNRTVPFLSQCDFPKKVMKVHNFQKPKGGTLTIKIEKSFFFILHINPIQFFMLNRMVTFV